MTDHKTAGAALNSPGLEGRLVTAYQVMPPLTDEERAALKADIEQHGVMVPVVRDQHGNVLDGHNRAEIADELGIKYRVDIVSVEDEQQARTIARTLNLARRHLSRAQKRQLIADEITANAVRSDREIGRLLGCDHKTVGSVRRELNGELPQTDEPLTTMEREEVERLTEQIRRNLRSNDQTLMEQIHKGVPPALIARGLRQVRKEFGARFASEFGDDFGAVDEALFCGWLDDLAALHNLTSPDVWPVRAEPVDIAWLEAWAEARPKQHAEHVQMWAEAWPTESAKIGV